MSSLTVQLNDRDRDRIVNEITERLAAEAERLATELKSHLAPARGGGYDVTGTCCLSLADVAARLGKSDRTIRRLEARGEVPRRRKLWDGDGRVFWLEHEIESKPVPQGRRRLNQAALGKKLGITPKTVKRHLDELPKPEDDGVWWEPVIDEWLLSRPLA